MNDATKLTEYVTFTTAGQLFGLPIERVQDVFKPARMTRVPLAGPEIAGVLNLRGRIVTAINLGKRLDLAVARRCQRRRWRSASNPDRNRSVCLVDAVGEVLKLSEAEREPTPINLERKLARVAAGVFRLDGQLLVVLDVDRVLDLGAEPAAAAA